MIRTLVISALLPDGDHAPAGCNLDRLKVEGIEAGEAWELGLVRIIDGSGRAVGMQMSLAGADICLTRDQFAWLCLEGLRALEWQGAPVKPPRTLSFDLGEEYVASMRRKATELADEIEDEAGESPALRLAAESLREVARGDEG